METRQCLLSEHETLQTEGKRAAAAAGPQPELFQSPALKCGRENKNALPKNITIEPGKRGGRPCIRRMRIAVGDVLGWLAAGMTHAEIIEDPE